jgi:hypothetical protein
MGGKGDILVGKDRMEPSILLQRLRPWRDEDAERAVPLVQKILSAHGHDKWADEPFRWEASVYPLFYYTKDIVGSSRSVYERIFEWAGEPSDDIDDPSIEKMLGPVADAEVDLLIESANYFMFIEAKVLEPGQKPKFQRNKPEYGAIHQLVRQCVQGRILEDQIKKKFMLATLGALDTDKIDEKLNEGDRRLLKVMGHSGQEFPKMLHLGWELVTEDA